MAFFSTARPVVCVLASFLCTEQDLCIVLMEEVLGALPGGADTSVCTTVVIVGARAFRTLAEQIVGIAPDDLVGWACDRRAACSLVAAHRQVAVGARKASTSQLSYVRLVHIIHWAYVGAAHANLATASLVGCIVARYIIAKDL